MTNRFSKYIVVVFLSMFLAFQVGTAAGQTQQPSTPVTLKAVTFPFLSFAPFFIAQEEGYFTEQGLQIEFIKMKEEFAFQALAKGEVDVWSGLVSIGALNAMHRGAQIRFFRDDKWRFTTQFKTDSFYIRRSTIGHMDSCCS